MSKFNINNLSVRGDENQINIGDRYESIDTYIEKNGIQSEEIKDLIAEIFKLSSDNGIENVGTYLDVLKKTDENPESLSGAEVSIFDELYEKFIDKGLEAAADKLYEIAIKLPEEVVEAIDLIKDYPPLSG